MNSPVDSVTQHGHYRVLSVLHVATMLRSGGVERWLVDLCPAGRAENLSMDIAVLVETDGLFERLARERGIRVFQCPGLGRPLAFMRSLWRLIRQHGPYDAVHAHLHAFSGFAVAVARLAGVPARIVHSHNVVGNSSQSLARRTYVSLARVLIRTFATAAVAPAALPVQDLMGSSWNRDPRWRVMPCGIDLTPFRTPVDSVSSRAALRIPPGALVLGSVGRLIPEKNSEFLVDILAAVLRRVDNACLLLVGEGPLRDKLEAKARLGGFGDRIILPGTRSDVPALLRTAMDVFVFPSPPPPRGNEALPLAVVEAQAAGLPGVFSDGVPPEAIIIPELITQIPADAGADRWAEAVVRRAVRGNAGLAAHALSAMEQSDFNCLHNLKKLAKLYRNPQTP